jgi:hypothetical protein
MKPISVLTVCDTSSQYAMDVAESNPGLFVENKGSFHKEDFVYAHYCEFNPGFIHASNPFFILSTILYRPDLGYYACCAFHFSQTAGGKMEEGSVVFFENRDYSVVKEQCLDWITKARATFGHGSR